MRHAVSLALVGLIPGIAGVVVGVAKPAVGRLWYPIVLAVTGLPCAWVGGVLYRSKQS